ncbi:MAG TPA: hypothetical protein VJL37_05950 [Flavobacterium sp.]|jgi:hypothetical protein|nr:hypothetical protein [Flavobacterium sp.]
MLNELKVKKIKDPIVEKQKIIDNHKMAALHHEIAAKHHQEAVKQHLGGNHEVACTYGVKAKIEGKLAQKAFKKSLKKYASVI